MEEKINSFLGKFERITPSLSIMPTILNFYELESLASI